MKFCNWPQSGDDESPRLELRELLPDVIRRIDADVCADLDADLRALRHTREYERWTDELSAPDVHLDEQLRLWRNLLSVLRDVDGQWTALRQEFQRFSERFFAQIPGRGRREILEQYLESHAESAIELWRDRRALDEYLDYETLRERQLEAESDETAALRVLLLALEGLATDIIFRAAPIDYADIACHLLDVPTVERLLHYANNDDPADLSWLALRAAAPLLAAISQTAPRRIPPPWLRLLVERAVQPTPTSWIAITALEILAPDPEAGVELLSERAATGRPVDDDWHVRAHAIRLLADHHPGQALEILSDLYIADAPDGVASAACQALGELRAEQSIDRLDELVDADDTAPTVRGHAARALATLARQGGEPARRAAQILARIVVTDQNGDVVQTTINALRDLFDHLQQTAPELATSAAGSLRPLLATRLETENDAVIANALAAFRLHLGEMFRGGVDDASPDGETIDAGDADSDDAFDEDITDLASRLGALSHGDSLRIDDVGEATLRRALVLATRSGFGLYAKPRGGGWRVERGERFRTRLWRVLYEIRNPAPDKRQDQVHSKGRVYPGSVRAHPVDLGEVTPTAVPGERRQVSSEGGWGEYLPLVDDVLDAQLSRRPISLCTDPGTTVVHPPSSLLRRLVNWWKISWNYDQLDALRLSSLEGTDADQRGQYLGRIEDDYRTHISFEPHRDDDPTPRKIRELVSATEFGRRLEADDPLPRLEASNAAGSFSLLALTTALYERFPASPAHFVSELFDRTGARIQELAIVVVFIITIFLGRMLVVRQRIDHWRSQIPLCIGGWGTRGKSGTERLKAALFHRMGHDTFVKTTGCEAMFIHAPARTEAREIFVYRPYDKATIWEQRDMLRLGTRLGCDVFLWECMALSPRYVEILQLQWMNDDLVTLTNAYPDHEDIQGPTGIDVARTISRFMPKESTALTAEREMLPIFKQAATEKKTELITVGHDEEFLLTDSVMERFPYSEHPRNISLVARMATELGIDREFAVFAMADNVVPDLGVLKAYPRVNVLGRHLSFINGCSANERAGFLANWKRTGLADIDPRTEPGRRVVTVVNNRDDRIARSRVFADILVRDVAADGHVLIGTNLAGLKTYMSESLQSYLANVRFFDDPESVEPERARKRLIDVLDRVRMVDHPASKLCEMLDIFLDDCRSTPPDATGDLQPKLGAVIDDAIDHFESLETTRQFLDEHDDIAGFFDGLTDDSAGEDDTALATAADIAADNTAAIARLSTATVDDARHFFVRRLASTVGARYLRRRLDLVLDGEADGEAFHAEVRALYEERFWQLVSTVDDPDATGDAIIAKVAQRTPPGCDVEVLGTQNIKGTGLDFVYRWVELNNFLNRLDELQSAEDSAFRDEMMAISSSTTLALTEALAGYHRLSRWLDEMNLSPAHRQLVESARTHLSDVAQQRFEQARDTGDDTSASWYDPLLASLERFLDPFDAIFRRRKADRLQKLLVNGRISHPRMAMEMQKLVKRQKGGWLAGK